MQTFRLLRHCVAEGRERQPEPRRGGAHSDETEVGGREGGQGGGGGAGSTGREGGGGGGGQPAGREQGAKSPPPRPAPAAARPPPSKSTTGQNQPCPKLTYVDRTLHLKNREEEASAGVIFYSTLSREG